MRKKIILIIACLAIVLVQAGLSEAKFRQKDRLPRPSASSKPIATPSPEPSSTATDIILSNDE